MATVQAELGRPDVAQETLQEAANLSRQIGDDGYRATGLNNLAIVLRRTGDLEGAERLAGEALELFERLSDNQGKAAAIGSLGLVNEARGNSEGAEKHYREAHLARSASRSSGQTRTVRPTLTTGSTPSLTNRWTVDLDH